MRHIALDDKEIEAVIEFQRSMAEAADDSCEYEEAKQRKSRAAALRALLGKKAA